MHAVTTFSAQIFPRALTQAIDSFDGSRVLVGDPRTDVHYHAAGLADADGVVSPEWIPVLQTCTEAQARVVLIAQHGGLMFVSTIHRGAAAVVSITNRASVVDGAVDLMEPLSHVQLAPAGDWWHVVRGLLPDVPAFRTPPGNRIASQEVEPPSLTDASTLEQELTADPDIRALAHADAVVSAVCVGPGELTTDHSWALGDGRLYRATDHQLWLVGGGDVSNHLSRVLAA